MKKLRDYQNHIAGINERARMINSSNQKITIIVEGESDKIFFEQWLNDQNARIHFVEGKDYVYEVWENSLKRNFNSIICIVDIDYDKYLPVNKIFNDRFIYISLSKPNDKNSIECNDLESALIKSEALKKLCLNKFPSMFIRKNANLSNYINSLRTNLVNSAALLGSYRLINQIQYNICGQVYFESFKVDEIFFDPRNNEIKLDQFKKYIESKICGDYQKEDLHGKAEKIYNESTNPWELARGHDMSEMLSIHLSYLNEKFSTRSKKRYISVYEVEQDLRMCFDGQMVKNTVFGKNIDQYQNKIGKKLFQFA